MLFLIILFISQFMNTKSCDIEDSFNVKSLSHPDANGCYVYSHIDKLNGNDYPRYENNGASIYISNDYNEDGPGEKYFLSYTNNDDSSVVCSTTRFEELEGTIAEISEWDYCIKYPIESGEIPRWNIPDNDISISCGCTENSYDEIDVYYGSQEISEQPTEQPEVQKTEVSEVQPTEKPEVQSTEQPEVQNTEQPEVQPTEQPEVQSTVQPTEKPEVKPTVQPTKAPEVDSEDVPGSNYYIFKRIFYITTWFVIIVCCICCISANANKKYKSSIDSRNKGYSLNVPVTDENDFMV